MDIGIFVSMTGQDHSYKYRYILHNYLADVALGETPWLNHTTMCSFPEPWYSLPASSHHAIDKTQQPTLPIGNYIGTYHNVPYGNLTVSSLRSSVLSISAPSLHMRFGVGEWTLYPQRTGTNRFRGEASGILYKMMDLYSLKFHTSNSHIISLEIPSFEDSDPPVFTRVSNTVHHHG